MCTYLCVHEYFCYFSNVLIVHAHSWGRSHPHAHVANTIKSMQTIKPLREALEIACAERDTYYRCLLAVEKVSQSLPGEYAAEIRVALGV
jgi:hypothetical protein